MDLTRILEVVDRLATLYMRVTEESKPDHWRVNLGESSIRCDDCGAEPFAVRWGRIRVGYDLDGYYSQLTSDGTARLLCRDCWHVSIGMDDPLRPKQRSPDAHDC